MKTGETQPQWSVLLAECLFRANRFDELERLRFPTPQVRFWQGAGHARQGRLQEALTTLREVSVQQPEFQPARQVLAELLRQMVFRHAKAAEWEAAVTALAEAQHAADGLPALDNAPVVEALIFLLAGRRQDAIRTLEEAQRRYPSNGLVAHALGLGGYHAALASPEQYAPQDIRHTWEYAIAAWGTLMYSDSFWEKWRSDVQVRYQVNLSDQTLEGLRKQIGEHLQTTLANSSNRDSEDNGGRQDNQSLRCEMLVQRELKAADLLHTLGGFPLPGMHDGRLVCGPLMIQLLGVEHAFGEFVSEMAVREEKSDDPILDLLRRLLDREDTPLDKRLPDPAQQKRLRRYFSQVGIAQTLLDLDRSQEALTALLEAGCPRCQAAMQQGQQRRPPANWSPVVCAETCPEFDTLNPGYAGLQDKSRQLKADAFELAVEAKLGLAQSCITAAVLDVQAATDHWQEAIRLSKVSGNHEQTQHRIVETTLGRVQALEQRSRLDEAVSLLKAAERICDDHVDRELVGRLAEVLTNRGIKAGNETLPRWEAAVTDLRRAVGYNPHAARSLVNLGIALRVWAVQRYAQQKEAGVKLLQEAVQQLQEGLSRIPGHAQLQEQYRQAQDSLRSALNGWVVELANAEQFDHALGVLRQALRQFPEDPLMRENKRNIFDAYGVSLANSGQHEQAVAVFEQGLREFPGDLTMTKNLAQVRLMIALRERRRW